MKTIQLTQCKVAIVDDDDFDWLSKFNWCVHKGANTFYAKRGIKSGGKQTGLFMHRVIMEHHGRDIDGLDVDHRNHDGLDNQKENLRPGTRAENLGNMTCHDDSFIGVSLGGSQYRYWNARIWVNRKRTHIGSFETALEGALAHDQYVIDHNLTDYPLNFPEVFRP